MDDSSKINRASFFDEGKLPTTNRIVFSAFGLLVKGMFFKSLKRKRRCWPLRSAAKFEAQVTKTHQWCEGLRNAQGDNRLKHPGRWSRTCMARRQHKYGTLHIWRGLGVYLGLLLLGYTKVLFISGRRNIFERGMCGTGKQAELLILIDDPLASLWGRHLNCTSIMWFFSENWVWSKKSGHLYSPPSSIRIGPTVSPISSSPSSRFPLQGTFCEFAGIPDNLGYPSIYGGI